MTPRNALLVLAAASALAALVVGPYLGGAYMTLLLAQSFLYAITAISLDLVWGYAGIPEMGHSLWFGIGALCVGMMTTKVSDTGMLLQSGGTPGLYLLSILAGVAVSAALAAIVAWYSFSRSSTHFYIAVVGLALVSVAHPAYTQFPSITGGEIGLFGFAYMGFSTEAWYVLTATLFVVVMVGSYILVRSDFGLLIRAVRDNENRVRYLGFNVERVKITIYALSAGLAALAGAIYACMMGAVSAPLFGMLFSTEMLVWVAVGGRGTIFGPALGTVALSLAGAQLSASFPSEWSLFLGLAFVLVVVVFPHGILPPVAHRLSRIVLPRTYGKGFERKIVSEGTIPFPGQKHPVAVGIENLVFSYGRLHVLRGVSLEILRGELLCIVGPNGAGKSTLIEVLTDGERFYRGHISYGLGGGLEHQGKGPDIIARHGIVRKFQVPSLFASLTVAEHILLASCRGRWPSFWRRTHVITTPSAVAAVCEAAGLDGRMDTMASTLSHGLSQGLEMALAVAARPQIVFMDEPTAGLTANERAVVGKVLKALTASGITVTLIEHDLDFVEQVADRIAVLHDGAVLEVGRPAEIARSAVVKGAYLGSFELEQVTR